MPLTEIAELKVIFDEIDGNRSGQVEFAELKKIFIQIGIDGRVT